MLTWQSRDILCGTVFNCNVSTHTSACTIIPKDSWMSEHADKISDPLRAGTCLRSCPVWTKAALMFEADYNWYEFKTFKTWCIGEVLKLSWVALLWRACLGANLTIAKRSLWAASSVLCTEQIVQTQTSRKYLGYQHCGTQLRINRHQKQVKVW